MKAQLLHSLLHKTFFFVLLTTFSTGIFAQTNVFDDIIATSPDHTTLANALVQEGLDVALQNNAATLTVFAPDNAAFDDLASALNTTVAGLLALPNLSDILTYHVLGTSVQSSAINNGDIVTPLNTANTVKLTKISNGAVYANQAMVNAPDLMANNGYVHSVSSVLLPSETVVDIAIDNGFTTLTAAVVTAELLPALTDPLAELTVFAPDNAAFDNLANALSTDINGLLALPNLTDILTYHVLGTSVQSSAINNGDIVLPLSSTNTIKLTKTAGGMVYVNQAIVNGADIMADNGYVHTIDAVILPYETVVDVAIDNGFTTLTTAVVTAELLPALTDPLAELTVFAPDNAAFDNLAADLNTDLNGILALPDLSDILLYHVVSGTVLSSALTNGNVSTLNGQDITVDITAGVKINSSNVTLADVTTDNGVVHVIDAVLVPATTSSIDEIKNENITVFPNPTTDIIQFKNVTNGSFQMVNNFGVLVKSGTFENGSIDVSELANGTYYIQLSNTSGTFQTRFIKL